VLAQYPFDYVLGSLHWVGADFVFDDKFYKRPAAEAFGAFFGELAVMTLAGGFDVLSHFDLPARMSRPFYGDYDPTPFAEPIRAVLANCVAHGIALDINTAALRRNTPTLTPGEVVLRWYRELGGERITLGSDSHRPANLGANLKDAIAAARAAGFRYVTSYQQRVAHMVPLP
jgi:histidinol-phosphatase (PHP family)